MTESVDDRTFKDLLVNVQSILIAASVKCRVVDESFPAKFFEKNPDKIYESYCKFIRNRSNSEGSIRNEDKLALTTINKRFEDGEYEPVQGGFYKLYHDIKLVCTMLIHFYPQGTRNYQLVDKFYKFSSELLLRECFRIGIALTQTNKSKSRSGKILGGNEADDYDDDDATELDKTISNDFIKISMNYSLPISQTFHIKTKDLDLFSSIISKSNLDKRPHELPNTNFKINNVIPQTDIENEAPRLGFVGANTSNIPDPTLPPTEMMTRFLHPNWYALPTTVWLKYGNYNSWAPSFNENGTVVDSTTRGLIWLERIGYMDLYETSEKKTTQEEKLDANEDDKNIEQKHDHEVVDGKIDGTESVDDNDDNVSTTSKNTEGTEDNEQTIIKLQNLYNWTPSNHIGDDEVESFQNGTPDKLVSESLLKLKQLRKERILNRVSKPTTEEREVYFKVKRILKEIILAKKVSKLPINSVRAFPVLQTNYNGSIPVVRAQPGRKRKHKK
ncbi:Chromatin structure-remodeling complex protein rsc58 [Saccharomyces pastorianus]|uniref:Chromatin structure-remodeling complex protein rsc58 n=1 Tax=Saccharomyces pastorianus TaxID=27292 RepID=A0A6C1EDD2_SACPS|nr:Chromatin structure-remodeling complex protein rsc58 [Saccharomyces pastorianus]